MNQPILNLISSFDANFRQTFEYTYLGSEQISTNELKIREDKVGSAAVYQRETTKFDKNHILPAEMLVNGKEYVAQIRVKDANDVWSPWSPEMRFVTLATPKYVYENLNDDKYVYNDDVMMRIVFQQEQGDKPEYYNFVLLDQNKVPIRTYNTKYPEKQTPNVMTERISDLKKGVLYYIGCYVHTLNGIDYFDSHEFIPHFVAPSTTTSLVVNNDNHDGQVLVQGYLRQQLGIQTYPNIPTDENNSPMKYVYLNDNWLVIPPNMPLEYRKLGVGKSSDYALKVWLKNIPNGKFLELETEDGNGIGVDFIKYDDYIVAEKRYLDEDDTGIVSIHQSNEIKGLKKGSFYMYVKAIEFRIEVSIKAVS